MTRGGQHRHLKKKIICDCYAVFYYLSYWQIGTPACWEGAVHRSEWEVERGGGRGGGGQFTSPKWVLRGGLAQRVIQCRTATALTWPTCNSSRLQETRLSRMCFSFRKWITTINIMPFSSLVMSYGILFRRSDPGLQIATLIYFTFLF